jgi:hypothetical protein
MDINPAALEKLKSLNDEFIAAFRAVADREGSNSFDAWRGGAVAPVPDMAHNRKELEEYSQYNRIVGGVLNDLTLFNNKKEDAVHVLKDLKVLFGESASFYTKASRSLFASFGEEKKLAAKYKNYAERVAEVLKLL